MLIVKKERLIKKVTGHLSDNQPYQAMPSSSDMRYHENLDE